MHLRKKNIKTFLVSLPERSISPPSLSVLEILAEMFLKLKENIPEVIQTSGCSKMFDLSYMDNSKVILFDSMNVSFVEIHILNTYKYLSKLENENNFLCVEMNIIY